MRAKGIHTWRQAPMPKQTFTCQAGASDRLDKKSRSPRSKGANGLATQFPLKPFGTAIHVRSCREAVTPCGTCDVMNSGTPNAIPEVVQRLRFVFQAQGKRPCMTLVINHRAWLIPTPLDGPQTTYNAMNEQPTARAQ